ncbi:MAG TPA: NUDIX domain-containing protein [Acidimicrobiales bacterium]|nr:NUDIX domain-containing protein [Acidimicrobiales bacterium]
MAIAPYLRRIRELVGHELLVLPGVAVVPRDPNGRILLVRIIDTSQWALIGGTVEPDESPDDAAIREAQEEAGVRISLGPILGVIGGPEFRISYPNGDETSYVSTVFDATVIGGTPTPDHDETSEVRWWDSDQLPADEMSSFTRALMRAVGFALPVTPA